MELKIKKDAVVGIPDFFLVHSIQDINVPDTSNCITKSFTSNCITRSFKRLSKHITK